MDNIDLLDLDFDDGFKYANTIKKDLEGFVKGQVIKIEKTTVVDSKERTTKTLQDDISYIAVKFHILLEGTQETINTHVRTGTNLNPEKVYIKNKGRGSTQEQPEYNAFTEISLRLGLIDIHKLENRDIEMLSNLSKSFKNITKDNPIYIKTKLTRPDDFKIEVVNIRTIEKIAQFSFNYIK